MPRACPAVLCPGASLRRGSDPRGRGPPGPRAPREGRLLPGSASSRAGGGRALAAVGVQSVFV